MCTHTSLCYLLWRLCSLSPGQKGSPLLALYAVELLMVFLMAADGRREPLALGLGVQRSFNKSKSVLCHYINIFGQLLRRSGGAASYRSLWYAGMGETSGAAKPRKRTRWTQKKKSHKHTWIPAGVLNKSCCFSNYLQAAVCAACKYKREGKYGIHTMKPTTFFQLWKWNPGTQRQYTAKITTFGSFCVKSKPAHSHAIKMYSPKFPFNKESENENIIFSQADGDCCFLTAGI